MQKQQQKYNKTDLPTHQHSLISDYLSDLM